MNRNEGTADRIVRVLLGTGLLGAGLFYQNWLGLVGLVPLITGLSGRCLLYHPFRISTMAKK
jgi:hypothetical protein